MPATVASRRFPLCIALLAATALSAAAAELWVATTGSDAPGTAGDASAPFLTLTNALAHASDYDTIRVRAGTYPVAMASRHRATARCRSHILRRGALRRRLQRAAKPRF